VSLVGADLEVLLPAGGAARTRDADAAVLEGGDRPVAQLLHPVHRVSVVSLGVVAAHAGRPSVPRARTPVLLRELRRPRTVAARPRAAAAHNVATPHSLVGDYNFKLNFKSQVYDTFINLEKIVAVLKLFNAVFNADESFIDKNIFVHTCANVCERNCEFFILEAF